ncbi:hypothetical protein TRVL_07932 [Trypanosoma vivax]|nr:hypothetical protein TRVL_07932 [Trypanosoma vivax]
MCTNVEQCHRPPSSPPPCPSVSVLVVSPLPAFSVVLCRLVAIPDPCCLLCVTPSSNTLRRAARLLWGDFRGWRWLPPRVCDDNAVVVRTDDLSRVRNDLSSDRVTWLIACLLACAPCGCTSLC